MGKQSKIIHILPHSPASSAYEAKVEDKAPKWKTSYDDDSKNYENYLTKYFELACKLLLKIKRLLSSIEYIKFLNVGI